jgi:deazaflavin-dependent oxidoreductase (nitroreductase family)
MRWLNPFISRRFRSGRKIGPSVLVLITTGRKSGKPHHTPLQYELVEEKYYVGSARGILADWYCNILADPVVKFELKGVEHNADAEVITDPGRIADFLEFRLERNPRMIGIMMRLEGLPIRFTRAQLEEFSSQKALVILHPRTDI